MQENQKSVSEWCKSTFRDRSPKERALAVFEEAVELALAAQVDSSTLVTCLRGIIKKEAERGSDDTRVDHNVREEAADTQLCLYALAGEWNFDLEQEMQAKMLRNRLRPLSYYQAKQADKRERGIR